MPAQRGKQTPIIGYGVQPSLPGFMTIQLDPAELREALAAAERRATAAEERARELEVELARLREQVGSRHDVPAEGRDQHRAITGAPIRDAEGRLVGAVAVLRDVTAQQRLARRTRDALDALLAMAEALVSAEADPAPEAHGSIEDVARRLAHLIRQVLGCERVSIMAHDPRTGRVQPLAIAGVTPEQERVWIEESPAALGSPHDLSRDEQALTVPLHLRGQLVGSLAVTYGPIPHDFTPKETALAQTAGRLVTLVVERERLLVEREQARGQALAFREANRRMDEFLSIASHELRTPVTAIKANLQIVARRMRQAAEGAGAEPARRGRSAAELLARAERQVQRLTRLLDDLADVGRIREGELELRPARFDLRARAADVVDGLRAAQPSRAIALHLPPGPDGLTVFADGDRIGQVMLNYLSNALKYSPEEAPVEVAVEARDGAARVAVRDRGPGIPPEEQPRAWELFHRVPGIAVLSGSGIGLGLGLHISRAIVERHGGAVGVESAPGAGSTFWFTLPLAAKDGPADRP